MSPRRRRSRSDVGQAKKPVSARKNAPDSALLDDAPPLHGAVGNRAVQRLVRQGEPAGASADGIVRRTIIPAKVSGLSTPLDTNARVHFAQAIKAIGRTTERRATLQAIRQMIEDDDTEDPVTKTSNVYALSFIRDRLAAEQSDDLRWAALRNERGVLYRDPDPLTVDRAATILKMIVRGSSEAFDGLSGDDSVIGSPDENRMGEWGIAARNNEAYIISGSGAAVSWTKVLKAGGMAIGHAHPYPIKPGAAYGEAGWETRAINKNANAFVAFDELLKDLDALTLVFPSNSDIVFSAEQFIPVHTVTTPYVTALNQQRYFVTNPRSELVKVLGADKATPLVFEIVGSRATDDGGDLYECKLRAVSNGVCFWSGDVVASASAMRSPPRIK